MHLRSIFRIEKILMILYVNAMHKTDAEDA